MHREPRHLEEWAALLGDDLSDDLLDRDDADRLVSDDGPT